MIKITNSIIFLLFLVVIVGQGCSPHGSPTTAPTATSQPTIPVPDVATPTSTVLNADFSQTGWFVYICEKENGRDLCLVSPDRQKIVAMGLDMLEDITSPTWSADGQTIAFGVSNGLYRDIVLVDINCVNSSRGCLSNIRQITSDYRGLFSNPDWSPDGLKIAYEYRMEYHGKSSYQIRVMNADGSNPTQLTEMDAHDPEWSPNGNEIAFVSYRTNQYGDVYVMNKGGSNVHQLTELLFDSSSPVWSPDGEWLIVVSTDGNDMFESPVSPTLIKVRADGSEVIHLGPGWAPAWSPDGKYIAYVNDTGLWLMDTNGANPVKVDGVVTYEPICWQPNIPLP